MTNRDDRRRLECPAIDGGNPLGFLAAVGMLRTLSLAWPDDSVRLCWIDRGCWRPVVATMRPLGPDAVSDCLATALEKMRGHPAFAYSNDLEVPPDDFRQFAIEAVSSSSPANRVWSDFVAAFGCEAMQSEKNGKAVIQDTDFRTMSGSGHQHFLSFLRNIVDRTQASHIHKSLFEPWRYDDPVENQTMRWDPVDDQRYALRWRNPSGDPSRKQRGTVLGANRLAIEALPLFPTVPMGAGLATTGFRGATSRNCVWTWPIWDGEASLDVVRSLLSLPEIQSLQEHSAEDKAPEIRKMNRMREKLRALGVVAVFRSQRLTLGKFRNFTPAHAV